MAGKKVIVVGAGCAGLSAAYTLQKQGIEVVTYEARDVVGGRCRNFSEGGYNFSVGAASTEPQWATTFEYLNELGLIDRIYEVKKQQMGFVVNGKVVSMFMGGNFWDTIVNLPGNIKFFFSSGMPFGTISQLVKVFGAMSPYMKQVDTKKHDFSALAEISNMSAEEFALKYAGQEAVDWFFYPYLTMMVLERPSEISIAHPISLFSLMKGMCCVEGGLGLINSKLYDKVKDHVKLSSPVKRIVIKDNKAVGVETAEGFVPADYVICALDAVQALQVIPDLPAAMRKPLETCRYSSTYYYQFGLEKQVINSDQDSFVIIYPAKAKSVISYMAKGNRKDAPKDEKPMVMAFTRGWEDAKFANLTPEERRRLVIREIQKIYPEFPDEPVITKVFRWDRAVNLESPGQFVAMQDFLKNHQRDIGGLYLAGEYLFLIACTEGALATGKAAAEMIIEDIKKN